MFKELRQSLFNRRHRIIVDECDVIKAVKVIAPYAKVPESWNTYIRNAGWEHQPDRWFVAFTCFDKDFASVVGDLVAEIPNVEILS